MNRSALALSLSLFPVLAFAQVQVPKEAALPSLAPLVESVKSAVVNVDVQKREGGGGEVDDEMLERFFGMRRPPQGRGHILQGMGSGFVIDPKGLVLTNNHVVEGSVTLRVRFDDGRAFDADVVGRDPLVDVALLKIKGKVDNLPALKLGDSAAMRVGDWVVAIGNPFGLASSVSLGIISATERKIGAGPYDQFLQTDAAINPGNSGGPLFNLRGEVVGMNTAIFSNPTAGGAGGNIGIGFAVPTNLIKAVIPQLEKEGAVTRGWLGVGIQDLTPDLAKAMGVPVGDGAVITTVNDGSPAKKAGVLEDDAITAIDGEKVPSADAFRRVVALKRPDSMVALSAYRSGKPVELKVKLGTRPDLENVSAREPKSGPRSEEAKPSRLGLSFQDMDPRLSQSTGLPQAGALIVEVGPGSVSERAGLRRGMVVIEANRRPINGRDELVKAISDAKTGTVLLLRVVAPGGEGRSLRALEIP
jgi:serine protease Do